MLNLDEIKVAIYEASEGKRTRKTVKDILDNIDTEAYEIRAILESGFVPYQHKRGTIQEGGHRKRRGGIQKPAFWPEQIIHHLIVRQLKPIIVPRMDSNVAGTVGGADLRKYKPHEFGGNKKIRGKGATWASKKMAKWIECYHGHKFYVLSTDIKSFYDSIDISILFDLLKRHIKDKRFLDLCWTILKQAGPGIPKGFYTSPWFAQLYLQEVDNYILQELEPDHYLRYMDNMFLFGRNKRKLRRMRDSLQAYLVEHRRISLNHATQVYRFEHPFLNGTAGRHVECLGYVIHFNRVTMRKNVLKRTRAKAMRLYRRQNFTLHECCAMMSYKGWFKHTCTRQYYKDHIRPYITWRKLRRIIRRRLQNGNTVENRTVHREAV